ncbi:MAG TPA: BNR-repeat neuraminidase N-terminal domain-containing protein, partial [Bacteroidia bacterium]|nr:BNR-repeat neuraminidase N-terminal domain-containing protein [Bacteroidia bacterium]
MKFRGIAIIGLLVLLMNTASKATVSSYSFASGAGNYIAITGTTLYTGTWDDGASSLLTLPFTFTYNNSSFTSLSVTPNGFITLGSVPSGTIYCGLQSASTPANSIAGYGTDLVGVSAGSSIQYTTSGAAPNRKFIVQWTDCDHYGTGGVNHFNFQIVLNETSNTIQVVYGTFTLSSTFGANTCSDASTESGNVGLLGGNAADFNIRKVLNGTNTWSTSTAGTVITDVCNLSPTNIPSSGLTYTWTPSAPVAMSYVSSTTTLINNGVGIPHPSTNNQVLQIQVVTTGTLTPLSISSLSLSTGGTTSPLVDLTNAKLYYTGISSIFSSTTQFGSTITNPNGAINFSGSASLQEGTNYFWLVYDIAAGSIVGDHISGCCNSIVGSGTMGTRTPTVTCPAGFQLISQLGTWTLLSNTPPHANGGGMILLSDGTVLCKTFSGGADGYGNIYDKLTPDANGSYANGTWSSIAPMINTRLYYSSQVLMDGRLYVAGGEYGTGLSAGEVYNPLTNTWTLTPAPGGSVSDANSEMLPDGRVLQALVTGSLTGTKIYDPITNTFING